ncbi:hypothetical protein [Candidatus Amarolinea dominans]|uniref:hypothetical protein n=1 Tax=Candidatus Amarolinea dominans TaxID=3140696 RepID=UPI001DCD45F0|nr:hypothetical protein [Anaerolineae bacterium]
MQLQLHRDNDQFLNWQGGGWRTIIENSAWMTYYYPLRGESWFNWANVRGMRIQVRRTYIGNNQWDRSRTMFTWVGFGGEKGSRLSSDPRVALDGALREDLAPRNYAVFVQ